MQTKLRAMNLLLTASLLWASTMSAAPHKIRAQNSSANLRIVGIASFYGRERQGHRMANGERFDRRKLTAACWFLPFGTQVRVRNLANDEEVVVTITDRGPAAVLHRIIDLSEAAALQLGFWGEGTALVFLQPLLKFDPEPTPMNASLIPPQEYLARIE